MIKKLISVLLCMSILLSGFTLSLAADANGQNLNFAYDESGYFKYADEQITYNNLKQTEKSSLIRAENIYIQNGAISFDFTAQDSAKFGIRFKDSGAGYYFLKLDSKESVYLLRAIGGESEKVVKKATVSISSGKKYSVEVKMQENSIIVSLDGKEIITYEDKYQLEGGFAFSAAKGKITVSNIKYEAYENTETITLKDAVNIYIGLDGNDVKGNGSYDKPYKTLEMAQGAARKYVSQLIPVNIIFKEGIYQMEKPFYIGEADTGFKTAPVTYMAEEGKEVIFSGGTKLNPNAFKVTTDKRITDRLYPEVAGKVYEVNLSGQGITKDMIDWSQKFKCVGNTVMDRYFFFTGDVFINGRKQTLSRWPNDDEIKVTGCTAGTKTVTDTNYARISFDRAEPLRWTKAENAFIGGPLMYEYYHEMVPLGHIDLENMEIVLGKESKNGVGTAYGYWAAYNLLEEIDFPGEYYIDFETMTMYIYLNEKPKADDVIEIATYNGDFIDIGNANYVTIKGFTFDKSAGPFGYNGNGAICIKGEARNLTIEDCRFQHIATQGIHNTLKYTNANLHIKGCDFINFGHYALNIGGGDLANMIPFTAVVEDCMFYDCIVMIGYQVGNEIGRYHDVTLKNNLFADTPTYTLIPDQHYGEASIIYNEFSHCATQVSDMSVIYTGRNPSGNHGTTIEYNLFHHYGKEPPFEIYNSAVYLDDGTGGGKYNHNIFYPKFRSEKNVGYYFTQGPDIECLGNTFVDCGTGIVDMIRPLHSQGTQWTHALNHAMSFDSFLEKYPITNRYFDTYNSYYYGDADESIYKSENTIIKNLSVNGIDAWTRPSYTSIVPTGEYEEPVEIDTKDIFVDAENLDFRVSFEAKEKYPEIPDAVLDESFNYDLIGMQRPLKIDETLKNFNITMPLEGEKNMYYNRVNLAWEASQFGSEYLYEVATDKEFKNIVKNGRCLSNCTTLTDLQPNTDYYFRVKAVSYMRKDGYEVYNQNGVQHLKTSNRAALTSKALDDQLDILEKELLPYIVEGTSEGEYVAGTRAEIEGIIKEGRALSLNAEASQPEINEKAIAVKDYIAGIAAKKVKGFATIELGSREKWLMYNSEGKVETIPGGVTLTSPTAINTFTFDEVLSNANLYNFKFKIENWESTFFTIGLRGQNHRIQQWSDDCYYVLAKKDIIEVQKAGQIYYSINNTFFENDKEYDIQFGTFTTSAGINVYMSVDGKKIVDFVDTNLSNAQMKEGKLSLMVPAGATITLKKTDEIPEGTFNFTEDTETIVKYGGHTLFGLDEIEKGESWNPTGYVNLLGYKEYMASDGSELKIATDGVGGQMYKVYYWNNPKETNDKAVSVSIGGFDGTYNTTIDLTQGEEGWVSLGTFLYKSEAGTVGRASITIKGSGNGDVPMSAIRIHKVENDLHPNLFLQK